jgi:hypothetical protein
MRSTVRCEPGARRRDVGKTAGYTDVVMLKRISAIAEKRNRNGQFYAGFRLFRVSSCQD